MKESEELILIKESHLNGIIGKVRELEQEVRTLRSKRQPAKMVLMNDDMRELLHVNNNF
jgi:hypothetical protein